MSEHSLLDRASVGFSAKSHFYMRGGQKNPISFFIFRQTKKFLKNCWSGLGPAWAPRQGEPQLKVQLLRMGTDRPGRWLCVTGLNRAIDGQKSVWSFVHQRSFAVVVSVGSERGRPRRPRSWHGEVSRLRTGGGSCAAQFVREGSDGSFVPATRALQPSRRTTRGKL